MSSIVVGERPKPKVLDDDSSTERISAALRESMAIGDVFDDRARCRLCGIRAHCWYCGGACDLELWNAEGQERIMCALHSAITRSALKLRALGENEAANELDDAVGIETRPAHCEWRSLGAWDAL